MKSENLAIVFVDIAGFTSRTSAQTREENLRLLRRFEGTVRPLVRAYSGRVIKTIGDAFLLTFRSPTDAILCSTAIHDRLAETDAEVNASERFTIRAAISTGEVRVNGGDVFGEAVNIASRIEGKAGAGEIYFSESAYLSMTRTEVPSEEIGYAELKGIPGKVRLYRVPRTNKPGSTSQTTLPYGGIGLDRVRSKLPAIAPGKALAPALDDAQGLLSAAVYRGRETADRFFSWWMDGIRRSRVVQYGTAMVLLAIILFMFWAIHHASRPQPRNPLQKLERSLGF